MFLDPEWRTFWTRQGFAVLFYDMGGNFDASVTMPELYSGLAEVGRRTGFPAIVDVPFVSWGHSASTSWNTGFAALNAERMIAYYTYHSRDFEREAIVGAANPSPAQLEVPYLFKSGRLDANNYGGGVSNPEWFELIVDAGRAHSIPLTGVMDIDLPHGSGVFNVGHPPAPSSPHHFTATRGNALYNFMSSRKGLEMAWLERVIEARLPDGGFDPQTRPLQVIDPASGWLGSHAVDDSKISTVEGDVGTKGGLEPPFGDGSDPHGIIAHQQASAEQRASWSWLPDQRVAELWQFYASGGDRGQPALAGVNAEAWNGDDEANQSGDIATIRLTRSGAWQGAHGQNRNDTHAFVAVEVDGTAELGIDYVFDDGLYVSATLEGARHSYAFDVPEDVADRYACDIPAGAVRFFNKSPFAFLTIRPINPEQDGDKTVVFRVIAGSGYEVGTSNEVSVVLRAAR